MTSLGASREMRLCSLSTLVILWIRLLRRAGARRGRAGLHPNCMGHSRWRALRTSLPSRSCTKAGGRYDRRGGRRGQRRARATSDGSWCRDGTRVPRSPARRGTPHALLHDPSNAATSEEAAGSPSASSFVWQSSRAHVCARWSKMLFKFLSAGARSLTVSLVPRASPTLQPLPQSPRCPAPSAVSCSPLSAWPARFQHERAPRCS